MSVADSTMKRTAAFPAAGASAASASIDLGADRVGAIGNRMTMHLIIAALVALADDAKASFTLEDSADDAAWAPLLTLDGAERTGAGGAGAEAKEFRFYLPPDTRRYIRVVATVDAGGGDNTAAEFTIVPKV